MSIGPSLALSTVSGKKLRRHLLKPITTWTGTE